MERYITKVIIPAAGLGTRFLPISKGICKEMLPLRDKPMIEHVVREAISSGIKEVVFVLSKRSE